ncbi:outer membrane autotransporter barrel domain-containing protein, partial [Azospirillum lipoferum]
GGPDFAQPMVVNYTNISYSATEIVYEGTYSFRGATEAVTCRVNLTTKAVTGTGACQNALGGTPTSTTGTTTTGTTGTTTTGTGTGTTTTTTTTTGTTVTQTTTLPDSTVTTVTVKPLTAAEQTRAWVRSGALSGAAAGRGHCARHAESRRHRLHRSRRDVRRAVVAGQRRRPCRPPPSSSSPPTRRPPPPTPSPTAKAVATTVLGRALSVRGGAGVSTGDLTDGLGLWVQPFGYGARQDRRDGQDGYLDRTLGVALGADARVADQTRVGVALTYIASHIDGRDSSSGDRTSVKGGNLSLYAQYEGKPFYVVGQVNAGISGYDSRRYIGLTGQAADADYRGWQLGARVDAGMPLALGGGWQATPMAGLAYVHSRVNGYTESGAGPLNLSVDDSRNNALTGSLGARVSYDHTADGLTWTPISRRSPTTTSPASGRRPPPASCRWAARPSSPRGRTPPASAAISPPASTSPPPAT